MGLKLLVLVCTTLGYKSLRGNHALTLVQEPTLLRASGHQEGRSKTNEDCEKSLEKEYVAPRVDAHAGNTPFRNASKSI
jgi:hypothetical protein